LILRVNLCLKSFLRRCQRFIERRWYTQAGCLWVLYPLEWLFRFSANCRRKNQQDQQTSFRKPVVIIGNIAVGGTGKTPVIIALIKGLRERGINPGVISRGYGRCSNKLVFVDTVSTADQAGDEPLEIYHATGAPVVVAADRVAAADVLVEQRACDVILSDDGLQHYKLARQREIVVVDASKWFGNTHCLPVGPLREPVTRLQDVNWVLINGGSSSDTRSAETMMNRGIDQGDSACYGFKIEAVAFENLISGERQPLSMICHIQQAVVVAGVGNPERVFSTVDAVAAECGSELQLSKCIFPDHHRYTSADFAQIGEQVVFMTAKDAVKCRPYAGSNWWILKVEARLPESFLNAIGQELKDLLSEKTDSL